jgi:hypothetical protein
MQRWPFCSQCSLVLSPIGEFGLTLILGVSQIGAIVTSLGLSTGPYVDKSIRGSVAGAYSLTGWPSHSLINYCRGMWYSTVDEAWWFPIRRMDPFCPLLYYGYS